MTIAELIPLVIQTSILLLVFGLGLHATLEDVTYLFRRPGVLVRALLAMGVVVPFFAAVLAALAIASSMRHPGVALAIAHVNFPGEKLVFAAVLLFAVVNAIVTIPYAAWRRRQHGEIAGGVTAER